MLVIGDLILDLYEEGLVRRISPEAPVPIVELQRTEYRLGGAANVAWNVQRLGGQATLCGVIGPDEAGQQLRKLIAEAGIDKAGIITHERPTTIKTRIISSGQQLIRLDREDARPLDGSALQQLRQYLENHLADFDLVILEDYDKGVLVPELIRYVLENHRWVAVDPKFRHFWHYQRATLFKPNQRELFQATGKETLAEAVQDAFARLRPRWFMVTLGAEGIYYQTDEGSGHQPGFKVEVADPTGAGDTVIAMLAMAQRVGAAPAQAALLANLAGSLVCQHVGTFAPQPQDLIRHARALGLLH